MFEYYNSKYREEKRRGKDDLFILETVMGEDAELGEDEEDLLDTESIPPEAMTRIDKELDRIIASDEYDDSEIDELIEDDDEIDEVLDEACIYL